MEEFKSIQNKALLWNLLYEGDVFQGIPAASVTRVQQKLDTIVDEIWVHRQTNEDTKE